MLQGTDFSAVGALVADPARANMLAVLLGGVAVSAGDLARSAGVTPSTASIHLAKLLASGWVTMEQRGRHRYYRLASADLAALLEHMALLAPPIPVHSLRGSAEAESLRLARSCYDHLAGKLGVALTTALVGQKVLRDDEAGFTLTSSGTLFLHERGVELPPTSRRAFTRRCLDWSERRDHLAGALGSAILATWLGEGWLQRRAGSRALTLTTAGVAELTHWGVVWPLDDAELASPAAR